MEILNQKLALPLKPFQVESVKYLLEHHYAILGLEMGLGKSPISIALALITELKTLVVCPAYLKENWRQEIIKFSKKGKKIFLAKNKKDLNSDLSEYDFIIVNYEILGSCYELMKHRDMVIADEAHFLKNPKSRRTDIFDELIYEYCPKRLILATGTPVQNRVGEFYQLMRLCGYNPRGTSGASLEDIYPNQFSFNCAFSNKKQFQAKGRNIIKFEGMKDVPKLKKLLRGKYIRFLCKDVLDLNDLVRKDIYVNYIDDPDLAEAYESNNLSRQKDSSAKAKSALSKTPFTEKYVKGLLEEGCGPVIVFTAHVEAAGRMGASFGVEPIIGSMTVEKRHRIVEGFKYGKTKVLVGTIGSMSTGLNLTNSNHIVFNDLSWVPGENLQAEKRIHRIGQDKTCFVHRILGSYQDAHITKLITSKMKVIKGVV
jgi:SNF2 family DNA or RNA helicase